MKQARSIISNEFVVKNVTMPLTEPTTVVLGVWVTEDIIPLQLCWFLGRRFTSDTKETGIKDIYLYTNLNDALEGTGDYLLGLEEANSTRLGNNLRYEQRAKAEGYVLEPVIYL